MNSELEACFDKWEASLDALCRYLLDTAAGVTGPVTNELAITSEGMAPASSSSSASPTLSTAWENASPVAPTPCINSIEGGHVVQVDAASTAIIAEVPTFYSTECQSHDLTESTTAFAPTRASVSLLATADVVDVLAATAASDGAHDSDTTTCLMKLFLEVTSDGFSMIRERTRLMHVPSRPPDALDCTSAVFPLRQPLLPAPIPKPPWLRPGHEPLPPWPSFNLSCGGGHQRQSELPPEARYPSLVQWKPWPSKIHTCLATTYFVAHECLLATAGMKPIDTSFTARISCMLQLVVFSGNGKWCSYYWFFDCIFGAYNYWGVQCHELGAAMSVLQELIGCSYCYLHSGAVQNLGTLVCCGWEILWLHSCGYHSVGCCWMVWDPVDERSNSESSSDYHDSILACSHETVLISMVGHQLSALLLNCHAQIITHWVKSSSSVSSMKFLPQWPSASSALSPHHLFESELCVIVRILFPVFTSQEASPGIKMQSDNFCLRAWAGSLFWHVGFLNLSVFYQTVTDIAPDNPWYFPMHPKMICGPAVQLTPSLYPQLVIISFTYACQWQLFEHSFTSHCILDICCQRFLITPATAHWTYAAFCTWSNENSGSVTTWSHVVLSLGKFEQLSDYSSTIHTMLQSRDCIDVKPRCLGLYKWYQSATIIDWGSAPNTVLYVSWCLGYFLLAYVGCTTMTWVQEGFQGGRCAIISLHVKDLQSAYVSTQLHWGNIVSVLSCGLIHLGKLCPNWKFAHSAIGRPTLFIPIQSIALKNMELWWFTTALLTEIASMFSAGFSMQLDVACSVQSILLCTPAYQLSILAPTMFGFAWGNVDCISISGTRCALQVISSELLVLIVILGNRKGNNGVATRKQRGILVLRTDVPWNPGGSIWHWWFSTCYNQDPFQDRRHAIAVTTFFEQVFGGHQYYLDLDEVRASASYYLGAFEWAPFDHDYYFHLVEVNTYSGYYCDSDRIKDRRLQWDPGRFLRCRLGVKPSFKEGGMLGPLSIHGLLLGYHHRPGPTISYQQCQMLHIREERQRCTHPDGSHELAAAFLSHLWLSSSPFPFLLVPNPCNSCYQIHVIFGS